MSPTSDRSPAAAGFTLMELMIVMTLLAVISLAVISAYLFMARNLQRQARQQEQDVAARRVLFFFTQDVGEANGFTSYTASNLTFTVPRPLMHSSTTSGGASVTTADTTGVVAGNALVGPGVPSGATVGAVKSATTLEFPKGVKATATTADVVLYVPGLNTTISYVYTSGTGTLTRTEASGTTTILKNIDPSATNKFIYYDGSGTALTLPLASAANVKNIGFSFTTKAGSSAVGTQSSYVIQSPRVVLRNWNGSLLP